MAISFQNQQIKFVLENKTIVKSWIKKVIDLEKKKLVQINFVFTSDAEILKSNVQFLNHDTYTDIITFDYCEGINISGDILISIERVRDNAVRFDITFDEELYRVIIHGVLHLCGYKDKTRTDAELMRKKENSALKTLRLLSGSL